MLKTKANPLVRGEIINHPKHLLIASQILTLDSYENKTCSRWEESAYFRIFEKFKCTCQRIWYMYEQTTNATEVLLQRI